MAPNLRLQRQAEAEKRRQEADYKTVEDEKHDSMRTLREKENELQAAKVSS